MFDVFKVIRNLVSGKVFIVGEIEVKYVLGLWYFYDMVYIVCYMF